MSTNTHAPLMLVLLRHSPAGRLAVNLQSFLHFNAEMDHRLQDLEHRWASFSTQASRLRKERDSHGRWAE